MKYPLASDEDQMGTKEVIESFKTFLETSNELELFQQVAILRALLGATNTKIIAGRCEQRGDDARAGEYKGRSSAALQEAERLINLTPPPQRRSDLTEPEFAGWHVYVPPLTHEAELLVNLDGTRQCGQPDEAEDADEADEDLDDEDLDDEDLDDEDLDDEECDFEEEADFPEGYAEEAITGLGLSEGPMTEMRAKLVALYHRSKTAAEAKEAEEEAETKAAAKAAEAGEVAEEEAIKDSLRKQLQSLENLLKSDGGNATTRNRLVRLHYQLGGHLASLETK